MDWRKTVYIINYWSKSAIDWISRNNLYNNYFKILGVNFSIENFELNTYPIDLFQQFNDL